MGYPCTCRSPGDNSSCPAHYGGQRMPLDPGRDYGGGGSYSRPLTEQRKAELLAQLQQERDEKLREAKVGPVMAVGLVTGVAALTLALFPPAVLITFPMALGAMCCDTDEEKKIKKEYEEKAKKYK
ncbi:hypothetical protein HZA87_03325 [Candidatus Uhrbacteria bacterium]|nr:hypothetical protein [Candidatus Uhrbacteria bacterium]